MRGRLGWVVTDANAMLLGADIGLATLAGLAVVEYLGDALRPLLGCGVSLAAWAIYAMGSCFWRCFVVGCGWCLVSAGSMLLALPKSGRGWRCR